MRYFFGFIGFLLLIIVGSILIVSHHHSTPKKPAPIVRTLPDYADSNSSVSMTIDGVVNGDDVHRAIRITVGNETRTIDIIQGYGDTVIKSSTQPNTKDAYSVFLKALNNANFTIKLKKPTGPVNPAGQCPDGTREIFTLNDNASTISSLWSSSCGTGTFGGNPDLVQLLFQRQITNYDEVTSDVQL